MSEELMDKVGPFWYLLSLFVYVFPFIPAIMTNYLVLILLTHSLSLFYERVKISEDFFLIYVNLHVILIEDAHFRL